MNQSSQWNTIHHSRKIIPLVNHGPQVLRDQTQLLWSVISADCSYHAFSFFHQDRRALISLSQRIKRKPRQTFGSHARLMHNICIDPTPSSPKELKESLDRLLGHMSLMHMGM